MTEKSLQARVMYRAKRDGWTVARVGRGWVGGEGGAFRTPTNAGWPDLVLFKPGQSILAMELKRERGIIAQAQLDWLALMRACGIVAGVVRPSDLREGRVDAILRGHG